MGGTSEREQRQKLVKIREKTVKRSQDVQKDFAKIERMKVSALKSAEEVRQKAQSDLHKIEKDVVRSKDLAPESKQRLQSEISILKRDIEREYSTLRNQISQTLVPIVSEQVNY